MGKKLFFLPKFRKLCGKYIGKSLDLDLVNVDVVMDDKTDAAMDDEMDVELAASSGVPAVNVTCLDDLVGFVENEWDLVDLNIEFNWTWIGFALQETRDDFISRVLVQSCKLFISSPLPIKSSTAILEALQITNPSSLQLTRSPDSPGSWVAEVDRVETFTTLLQLASPQTEEEEPLFIQLVSPFASIPCLENHLPQSQNKTLFFSLKIEDQDLLISESTLKMEFEKVAAVDFISYRKGGTHGAVLFKNAVADSVVSIIHHQGGVLELGGGMASLSVHVATVQQQQVYWVLWQHRRLEEKKKGPRMVPPSLLKASSSSRSGKKKGNAGVAGKKKTLARVGKSGSGGKRGAHSKENGAAKISNLQKAMDELIGAF